jgi:membrane protein implicated in regulation of membrane protease activity
MLVLAYIALAVVGAGYVLVATLLGHVSDAGGDAGHGDAGHGDAGHGDAHTSAEHYGFDHSGHGSASAGDAHGASFHFPFFSPLALATLTGATGALGLFAHYGLGLEGNASLLVAVPGAIALSYGVSYMAWRIVGSSSATSTIRPSDLEGAEGEVTTPIPTGGLGEVVAQVGGERFSSSAREADGGALPRGAHVRIVRLVAGTLVVQAAGRRPK